MRPILKKYYEMTRKTAPTPNPVPRVERDTPRVSSRELMAGRREIIIEHEGFEYRLCLTGSNKLILVK